MSTCWIQTGCNDRWVTVVVDEGPCAHVLQPLVPLIFEQNEGKGEVLGTICWKIKDR